MNLTRITHYCGLENKSRFLLNMKISALLSIVMIFSSFANSYSQVEISIDVKNQPIIKVLDEIESETDLRFIFGSEIYDFQKLKFRALFLSACRLFLSAFLFLFSSLLLGSFTFLLLVPFFPYLCFFFLIAFTSGLS